MKNNKFIAGSTMLAGILAFSFVQVQAEESQPIVDVQKTPDHLSMTPKKTARNVSMSVKGPDGFYVKKHSSGSGEPVNIDNVGELKDGVYHYEYTASSDKIKAPEYKDSLNQGRNLKKQSRSKVKQYEAISQSGYIVVKNGQIVVDEVEETAFDGDNK